MGRLSRRVVTLGIAAGVVTATTAAVLTGGWAAGAGLSMVAAITGLIEAAVLSRVRASRLLAVVSLPLLLAAAVVPATLGSMPPDGDPSAGHVAGRYLDAVTGGLVATSDWAFLVALCTALWVSAFWLGWFVLRERRGVIATLPCYTVLAINALNAPSLSRVAGPEAAAACLCLLLVAQSHLDGLASRWRAARLPVLPGIRRRFAVSMTVASAGVVGVALLVPPVTTRDISSMFFAAKVRPPQAAGAPSPRSGGGGGAPIAFSRNTRPGGPLVSRPRPALVFTTDGPAGDYLRLVNDTVFESGNWFPAGPATATIRGDGALTRDRDPGHGGVSSVVRAVHTTVTYPALAAQDAPDVAFSGEPDAVAGVGTATEAGIATARFTPLLTVDQVTPAAVPAAGSQVASTGLRPTATEGQLRGAGTAYPSFTSSLRTLPDDGSGGASTVRSLALTWTAGAATPYDQATAIETHLRDPRLFTYDLSPPLGPDSQWPITYFLTSGHRGYCQYFASSMGAMLRSLGIPARLVNGYGPGVVTSGSAAGVTVHALTTSDAHTWVEAYFPGYGWIAFEPTPPSALGDYQPPERGTAAPQVVPGASPSPASRAAALPAPTPAPPPARAAHPGGAASRLPMLAAPAVAIALVVAAAAWWLRPRSLLGLWRRIRLLGRLLRVRRAAAETDAAFAARLSAALPGSSIGVAAALSEIAAVSGRAQFAACGVGAAGRASWRSSSSILLSATPALLWRRLRRERPRGSGDRGRSAPPAMDAVRSGG